MALKRRFTPKDRRIIKISLFALVFAVVLASLFVVALFATIAHYVDVKEHALTLHPIVHHLQGGGNTHISLPQSCFKLFRDVTVADLPGFWDFIELRSPRLRKHSIAHRVIGSIDQQITRVLGTTHTSMPRALAVTNDCTRGYAAHGAVWRTFSLKNIRDEALEKCNAFAGEGESCSIALEQTYWGDSRQQPRLYYPLLEAKPWWTDDERVQGVVDTLESNYQAILEEYLNLHSQGFLKMHPEKLAENNDWKIFTLFSAGTDHPENQRIAPDTTAILRSLGDVVEHPLGLHYFSILTPGTHVRRHFGPTNMRVRIHLGLVTPPGARIEVGGETRQWEAGKCIVFDDSFSHEVWHDGESDRAILLVDVWHPELTEREREMMKEKLSIGHRHEN